MIKLIKYFSIFSLLFVLNVAILYYYSIFSSEINSEDTMNIKISLAVAGFFSGVYILFFEYNNLEYKIIKIENLFYIKSKKFLIWGFLKEQGIRVFFLNEIKAKNYIEYKLDKEATNSYLD